MTGSTCMAPRHRTLVTRRKTITVIVGSFVFAPFDNIPSAVRVDVFEQLFEFRGHELYPRTSTG